MWQKPALTQEKFIFKHKGLFEIVAIYENKIYKLADKCETLKILINENLLKLYNSYNFMKSIIVIN